MRSWRLMIGLTILAVLLSSCSLLNQVDQLIWLGKVGQGEVRAQAGQATVIFPDGVAPAGTKASVRVKRTKQVSPAGTESMPPVVEVSLADGLQPAAPVTIIIPVAQDGLDAAAIAERFWLFGSAVDADGKESFVEGTFDPANASYSMTVDHFSDFKVLGIDVGAALAEVKTAILQGIGLEFPAPDCVGESAMIDGTR